MQIYLDTTILNLYENGRISTRTYNCLRAVGLLTIGNVLNYANTPEELMK